MIPILPGTLQREVEQGASNLEKTTVPGFVSLHRRLTTQLLDTDGSTRSKTQRYDTTGVSEELDERHVTLARDAILLRVLGEVCTVGVSSSSSTHGDDKEQYDGGGGGDNGGKTELSDHLRELVYVISEYLGARSTGSLQVDEEIEELMADEMAEFQDNLPQIVKVISIYLSNIERVLVSMTEPLSPMFSSESHSQHHDRDTTSSSLSSQPSQQYHLKPSMLSSLASNHKPDSIKHSQRYLQPTSSTNLAAHLTTRTQQLTHTLPTLLTTLSNTLTTLLDTHQSLLTSTIRHNELHTHSTQTRHLTTHANFLTTVAEGLALKTQLGHLLREREDYAQEGIREFLRGRWEDLVREERELDARGEELAVMLEEFCGGEVEGEGEKMGDARGAAAGGGGGGGGGSGGAGSAKVDEVFETLGRTYGEVEREIEKLRKDIERLEVEVDRAGAGVDAHD